MTGRRLLEEQYTLPRLGHKVNAYRLWNRPAHDPTASLPRADSVQTRRIWLKLPADTGYLILKRYVDRYLLHQITDVSDDIFLSLQQKWQKGWNMSARKENEALWEVKERERQREEEKKKKRKKEG